MIGYILGKVMSINNGVALIENNGLGYEITCSAECISKLSIGKECAMFTYMAVREDGVYLYGFVSPEEKQMFIKLISVSGIGAKMGITILSNMNLNDLALNIATSNVKGLSSIKGLGKKTAERIILELREKVQQDQIEEAENKVASVKISASGEDAIIALMSLGFTKKECEVVVTEAEKQGETTVQGIVSYSLKHIR